MVGLGMPFCGKAQDISGWSLVDIGLPNGGAKGELEYKNGDSAAIKITSHGSGFGSGGDSLRWVGKKSGKQNSILTVWLSGINGAGWQGLTMRGSLESRSDGVFVGVNPEGKLGMLSRPDGDWVEVGIPEETLGLWLVNEKGSVSGYYYSSAAGSWEKIGAVQLEEAGEGYPGLVVSGAATGGKSSAEFWLEGDKLKGQAVKPPVFPETKIASGDSPTGNSATVNTSITKPFPDTAPTKTSLNGDYPIPEGKTFRRIYVDNQVGDDSQDGDINGEKRGQGKGPKKNLKQALAEALRCDAEVIEIVLVSSPQPYVWSGLNPENKQLVLTPMDGVIIGSDVPEAKSSNTP